MHKYKDVNKRTVGFSIFLALSLFVINNVFADDDPEDIYLKGREAFRNYNYEEA